MTGRRGFLIVSDLHLSEGRDPDTGWINPREDFLFDDDFADFLAFHTLEPQWSDCSWTLVMAGDFVDFLQVTDEPSDRPELLREEDYGLTAGPSESAWKMKRIMDGHPGFFRSLACFAARHRVVFVSGNHDSEMIYPEVRKAIVDRLSELAREPSEGPDQSPDVEFHPWFWLEEGIYVEHGHQYDAFNALPSPLRPSCRTTAVPGGEGRESIYFSLGSIFVRYLFNRVETSSPFADNIKPPTRFIGWFIRHHPLRALSFMFTDGAKMLDTIRRNCRRPADSNSVDRPAPDGPDTLGPSCEKLRDLQETPFLMRISGIRKALFMLLARKWMILGGILTLLLFNSAALAALFSPLWALLLPPGLAEKEFVIGILNWTRGCQIPLICLLLQAAGWGLLAVYLKRSRDRNDCSSVLRAKAAGIARVVRPEYIVMGHCHQPDLQRLNGGCHYINTGTWTKIFSHESAAVREEKEFIYTRIIGDSRKIKMDLMKWEGRGGTGRRANLIIS